MRDDPEDKLNPLHRGLDALNGWLYSIPIAGGAVCNAVESFGRTGKIRPSYGSSFPIWDSGKQAINAMSDENWGRAALEMTDAIFYYYGLPAATKRDIQKAIREEDWKRILGAK